jgi:two-component system repressor protein LuxO
MQTSPPPRKSRNPEQANILLVEDAPSLAELYRAYLTQECGYAVAAAASGRDALESAARNPPDAVLLDLRLPDMHGLELLDRLRERGMKAPVIVITGDGSIGVAVEAMRRGARDFLVKPFDIERLGVSPSTLYRKKTAWGEAP